MPADECVDGVALTCTGALLLWLMARLSGVPAELGTGVGSCGGHEWCRSNECGYLVCGLVESL